jgi:hypothetical protein
LAWFLQKTHSKNNSIIPFTDGLQPSLKTLSLHYRLVFKSFAFSPSASPFINQNELWMKNQIGSGSILVIL